jgi:hypothetical protein
MLHVRPEEVVECAGEAGRRKAVRKGGGDLKKKSLAWAKEKGRALHRACPHPLKSQSLRE